MPDPTTPTESRARIIVALPDVPELAHLGALPPSLDVRLVAGDVDWDPVLADAEVVVPYRLRAATLALLATGANRLHLIQTTTAGVDWLIGRVADHVTVCNARGVYDAPLAEWTVGAILASQRGLLVSRDAQARRAWEAIEPAELAGRRVVILGLGSIGSAIAERLRPFGVEVLGVGRTAREGGVRGLAELDSLLPAADVLVNILPLTTATRGLLDARRLALLPDDALVVNAGRGPTIVTEALVAELRAGRLRAVLDVTDPEPLPPDHALWGCSNALITPHMAGDSPASTIRAFALAGDQLRRYAAGEPPLNRVDRYLLE